MTTLMICPVACSLTTLLALLYLVSFATILTVHYG